MTEITIINGEGNEGPKNFSKGYLTIPYEGDQFKNFISSLLGRPQSISKAISGTFEIHLKDIQNFFDLINQRVLQQNDGQLIQFVSNIYYDDRSSVQLGSYEELITYNEVKPIISRAIRLTWVYLIQFPDKKYPEKQNIELVISTNTSTIDDDNILHYIASSTRGSFIIRIEHTARSWGFDIQNVISSQIESLLFVENKYKSLVREYSTRIGIMFAAIFFIICVFGLLSLSENFVNNELSKIHQFYDRENHSIDQKLNFLTRYVASAVYQKFYNQIAIFSLVAVVISVSLAILISDKAENIRDYSFLILTRKSKENRDRTIKRIKNNWFILLASLLGSLASGVISNYIFKILVE